MAFLAVFYPKSRHKVHGDFPGLMIPEQDSRVLFIERRHLKGRNEDTYPRPARPSGIVAAVILRMSSDMFRIDAVPDQGVPYTRTSPLIPRRGSGL
jgi:hypothetical protein